MSRVIKARELARQPQPFLVASDLAREAEGVGIETSVVAGDEDEYAKGPWGADDSDDSPLEQDDSPEPQAAPESPEGLETARVIAEAKREAEDIVREASERARQLQAEAEADAARLRDEARSEGLAAGREAGFQQGLQEGLSAVRNEMSDNISQATAFLEQCQAARSRILSSSRDDVLKIVRKCAEKIIRANVCLDPEIVTRVIHDALQLVSDKSKLLIRVNPSEVARAREQQMHYLQFLPASTQLEIMGDGGIEPGGCFIEAVAGSVDAQVETQLDELTSRLEGALNAG